MASGAAEQKNGPLAISATRPVNQKPLVNLIRGADGPPVRHRESQVRDTGFEVVHEAGDRAVVQAAVIGDHSDGEFARNCAARRLIFQDELIEVYTVPYKVPYKVPRPRAKRIGNRQNMRAISLADGNVKVSRIALGTASLHHLATERARINLLLHAADLGITHFDTAPSYGFGVAERSLALLFASRPSLTVATKVGLYAPGESDQHWVSTIIRKVGGKFITALSRPQVEWSVEKARRSLDASLRRLKRPFVDMLFLHEPDIDLIATDEWLRWLEDERNRVRSFGLAGDARRIAPFLHRQSALTKVLQTRDSLNGREADAIRAVGREPDLTYGHLASTRTRSDLEVERRLTAAITRNSARCVIVSTRRSARLAIFEKAANSAQMAIEH